MNVTLLLAGALLSQAAALPADQGLRADTHGVSVAYEAAVGSSTITASAPMRRRTGWLTTSGPDSEGQYRAWVNVADLNLATETGFSQMNSRVQHATIVLCDISAEQPQIPGFYNPGERQCRRSTQEQASGQMREAQDAARQGKPVAMLSLAHHQ